MEKIEFEVTGMTCDHCVRAVTAAIEGVSGVHSADVNLERGSAAVEGEDIDVDSLIAAVAEEGYTAAPISK
jgi:copper chaperone